MPAPRPRPSRTVLIAAVLAALIVAPSTADPPSVGPRLVRKLPPLAPPYPIAQPINIDRSMMRAQLAGLSPQSKAYAAAVDDLISLAGTIVGKAVISDAELKEYARQAADDVNTIHELRLSDAFFLGASVYAGAGRSVETIPDLIYEKAGNRATFSYTNLINGLNGQDIGIRYAILPASLDRFFSDANHFVAEGGKSHPILTRGAVSQLNDFYKALRADFQSRTPENDEAVRLTAGIAISVPQLPLYRVTGGKHKSPLTGLAIGIPEPPQDLTYVLKEYISVSQETAISLNGDYQTIDVRGYQSNVGVNVSKLLPIGRGSVRSAVTPIVSVDDMRLVEDLFPSTHGVRLGGALVWQDRAPALTPDQSDLVPAWNVKVGLEYDTPVLGAHETYAEFVRYRDPHSYVEMTVTAGKDGARADYLEVSLGKTYYY